MNSRKITKDQISKPSPLLNNSSVNLSKTRPLASSQVEYSRPITPFTAGRFDASASVVGGPNDPRIYEPKGPKTMTLRQFQSFCQALSVYRRQIQAMAAATETFVRALEELSDCVPAANIQNSSLVNDLDFLVDSTQLIANAHQTWASSIQRELEEPMEFYVQDILTQSKIQQQVNKGKIQNLIAKLHQEEDESYKQKKKNQRDVSSLQYSLNLRMSLAEEIKRLSAENESMFDIFTQTKVEPILNNLQRAVTAELETYGTIMEGMQKIERNVDEKSRMGYKKEPLSKIWSVRSSTIPSKPDTEDILPPSIDPEFAFLRDAFKHL